MEINMNRLAAALLGGTLAFTGTAHAQAADETRAVEPMVFSSAEFAQTGERRHPAAGTAWQRVDLPDSWNKQQRPRSAIGWYRVSFKLATVPRTPQAIYIPRVTNNVAVHVNDVFIGTSGRIDEREMSWNLAQIFSVPPSLLKSGDNELLIRLHPDSMPRAGLSEIQFGDDGALRPSFERRVFWQTTAPMFISGLLSLTALLSLSLWVSRRKETVFAFFLLQCLATKARIWHTFTRSPDSLGWLVAAPSLTWMMAMQTSFALRFCEQKAPRFEKFMWIYAGVSTVALIAFPSGPVILTSFLMNSAVALAMMAVLGHALTRKPNLENLSLLAAIYINFGLAIHDLLNYREMLGFTTIYLLPLGAPLLLFAIAILLIRRFTHVMEQHEKLNAELAQRVASREQELTVSYERLRQVDQQRTTAEERQRLMRDMHDGLGSHLMSTLALAKLGKLTNQQMQDVLTDCIDELKITIDSLEPVESDLLVVLGNLRYRIEPRLNAAGIELEWAVSDIPPLAWLDAENVRNVLRIVQEAFTNTLKHAAATRITVSTAIDVANARIVVRVTDNGNGLVPANGKGGNGHSPYSGRGLDNMKSRATKLNGQVEVMAMVGGGTCVNLYLPLAKVV
jgi:signal transduction histidine kinase